MKRVGPGHWRVILNGRTFDVIKHNARYVGGNAWSSYEDGDPDPITQQTRTRQEQLDDLDALVKKP